jgi:hypothetical protein
VLVLSVRSRLPEINFMQVSSESPPPKRSRAKAKPKQTATATPKPRKAKAKTKAEVAPVATEQRPLADTTAMVATAAYYLAAERNFTPGHELDDWLEAERRVQETLL